MDFLNKVAVITGGAQGIGKTIAAEFRKQGASFATLTFSRAAGSRGI